VLLRARWVLPLDRPPIRDGAVLIDGTGRIATVGRRDRVDHPPGDSIEELGNAILLPGLVNTHTHLELTGFEATANGAEFPDWILSIRRLKQGRTSREFVEAAKRGLRDCWAGGVTTVGDTGDSGAAMLALHEMEGSGIAYQEVFGPDPRQLAVSLDELEVQVERLRGLCGERARLGVSPHAPYTVSGPLFGRVASWARDHNLPIAVHIAESRAESEFVSRNTGRFAEAWESRGIPLLNHPAQSPPSRRPAEPPSPVGWLGMLGVLGPTTLCIHAINLSAADILLLRQCDAAVAHCPVSNRNHGHAQAPLRALLDAGIRVGLGTDSVASVGTLDLFAEMRAARELAGLKNQAALELATISGARALGLDRELGTLSTGKWGDLTAVEDRGDQFDPFARVLGAAPADVLLTMVGGKAVYRRA
jgi:5-methylthioadenosine/S-adenosylhomocysteine deaminase